MDLFYVKNGGNPLYKRGKEKPDKNQRYTMYMIEIKQVMRIFEIYRAPTNSRRKKIKPWKIKLSPPWWTMLIFR